MKLYTVYSHPSVGERAVKEGFRYPAFFFTWIWALTKGLWPEAFLLFVLTGVTLFLDKIPLQQYPEDSAIFLILSLVFTLAIAIFAGTNGSKWQKNKLLSDGFEEVFQVNSISSKAAIARFAKEPQNVNPETQKFSWKKPKIPNGTDSGSRQAPSGSSDYTFVFRVPTLAIEGEYKGERFEEVVEAFIRENSVRLLGSDRIIEIKRKGSKSGYVCYDLSELMKIARIDR